MGIGFVAAIDRCLMEPTARRTVGGDLNYAPQIGAERTRGFQPLVHRRPASATAVGGITRPAWTARRKQSLPETPVLQQREDGRAESREEQTRADVRKARAEASASDELLLAKMCRQARPDPRSTRQRLHRRDPARRRRTGARSWSSIQPSRVVCREVSRATTPISDGLGS